MQDTERNIIKGYLHNKNHPQVVERVWFDWCDFIGIQITAIKTIHKYIQDKFKSLILCVVVFQCNILNKIK